MSDDTVEGTTCATSMSNSRKASGGTCTSTSSTATDWPSSSEGSGGTNTPNRATGALNFSEASQSSNTPNLHDPANYVGKQLSDNDKVMLLTHIWKPPSETFKFPVTSGRRFNPSWLVDRLWLCYSVTNDSVFCSSCVCFGSAPESPFVSSGFKTWKKALGKDG